MIPPRITCLLIIILLVPFTIRNLAPALEPYPAVLFPLGIGTANIQSGTVKAKSLTVWGQNIETAEWEAVRPSKLLEPIPAHYLSYIVNNEFGLVESSSKEINTLLWGKVKVPRKNIDSRDISETKKWLEDRLQNLGYNPSVLRVTRNVKTIDPTETEVLSEEIIYEKVYQLD